MRPAATILEAKMLSKTVKTPASSQQQQKPKSDETKMPKDINNGSSNNNTKTNANVIEDTLKPTRSRFCQLLPVFIFLITFASVLSLLIAYTFVHRSYSCKY